ncbi:alpha/beta hydrolase [Ramlibacter henchirensis]|uniref:Alpha/beta hydrolase n=1 Tax=Ramlibacter henchirensis TaxID=204072 RepID=A0A4Z0C7V4_9BURK|nr:alpha/beta hydrolase [Ramlibacter henchirensis]TFZ06982.1 alpha/beta hydrolase [Ramlibacter henchirensis]
MADFVLVHGAWHGGWCWRRVVEALAREGHRAHAVTLTGVGERAHLLSPAITLETHIEDVRAAIEVEEMDQVVLAVHSYAGMIGTAIADRFGARLRHLVYVDAVVPRPGESWGSTHSRAVREARLASAEASEDYALPAPDPNNYGLKGADYEWVKRRLTAHPGHCYDAPLDFDPSRVAAVPRTFVSCIQPPLPTIDAIRPRVTDPKLWGGEWHRGGGAQVVELPTGHDPMVTLPAELTQILLRCA